MAKSSSEKKYEQRAIPTRLYPETVRIFRTIAAWKDVTMADFVHELAVRVAAEYAGEVGKGLEAEGKAKKPGS
jgi:hypothetical protein